MKLLATDRAMVTRSEVINNLTLSLVVNNSTNGYEIVIQGSSGKHKAIHKYVHILNDNGEIIHQKNIDLEIANFIFKFFHLRGDTESFHIYESEFISGCLNPKIRHKIKPKDVRHVLTNAERSFTSNGEKLKYHYPIFRKLKDTGYGSIIRATMTNHQVCASKCQFCSTISRNRKDSISLEEAIDFVNALYYDQAEFNKENFSKYNAEYKEKTGVDIRLRGLILSGGGQPNLWPYFSEFVDYLSTLDIDLGLITNGFPKHIDDSVYKKFKWIRISITPEDASPFYPSQKFNLQYIPPTIINNDNLTVGYSYVFGPWTTDDVLERIDSSLEQYGFDYCRTLTDCNLTRESQLLAHNQLAERLFRLGYIDASGNPLKKIFHQLKYHGTSSEANDLWDQGQCFLQTYNVFWDTTGHEENGHSHCYPCDSVTVLTDEVEDSVVSSERKFNFDKWGTVTNDRVRDLYEQPVRPFFDPRKVCSSCLFMNNNKLVKELVNTSNLDNLIDHKDIRHVNFP